MTKQFPLIEIEGGHVVVDKEIDIKKDKNPDSQWTYIEELHKMGKIIAHTGISSLKDSGLPLIDISNWNNTAEAKAGKWIDKETTLTEMDAHFAMKGFVAGYKAASAKQFTEEDVRNAFKAGVAVGVDSISAATAYTTRVKYWHTKEDIFIQSLKSKPVAVVLEMEEYDESKFIKNSPTYNSTPKISNNQVIVKEVIYE